ncbi:hypothetical protein L6R52_42215, partial [Myxococcota bacterium]|nr:hypothetical protein [Myxococcota bacterium]
TLALELPPGVAPVPSVAPRPPAPTSAPTPVTPNAPTLTSLSPADAPTPKARSFEDASKRPEPPKAGDLGALRLRAPRHSEIVRAIDNVPTVPVSIDQAASLPTQKPSARFFDATLAAKVAERSGEARRGASATDVGASDTTTDPGARDPANTPVTKIPGADTVDERPSPTLAGDLAPPAPVPSTSSPTWVDLASDDAFAPVPIPQVASAAAEKTSDRPSAPGPRSERLEPPPPASTAASAASAHGLSRWSLAFVVATLLAIALSLVLLYVSS